MVKGVIVTVGTLLSGERISPAAQALLQHIRTRNLTVAVISFSESQEERKRFIRSGLDALASFHIFERSKDLAFENAFNRLAMDPGEVMIVTRKNENILRANNLNCISVKVDPQGKYRSTPVIGDSPVYTVRNLEELIPLIG